MTSAPPPPSQTSSPSSRNQSLAQRPHPLPAEKLDSLDPQSAEAQAARKDLRKVNWLMGNQRWLAAELSKLPAEKRAQVLELGAGDGAGLGYFRSLSQLQIHGLDLSPRPAAWPAEWPWTQGNLFEVNWNSAKEKAPQVVIASLVLHHFEADSLLKLGQLCSQASELRFVEPARRPLHLLQGKLINPLLHPITRYDMDLSIRAGFLPDELAAALGLDAQDWQIEEQLTFFGALRFRASRRSPLTSKTEKFQQ